MKTCSPAGTPVHVDLPETQQEDEQLAALAKGLAHPVRVRILRLLAHRETCVCGELVDQFPLAQSTISQHLKILKAAGLVEGEVDGPRVCYCIAPKALRRLKTLISGLAGLQETTL